MNERSGYFEYHHVVGFEETNLVGNVYYVNYFRWQGRCREMFLRAYAPEVLADLRSGLKLFTVSCECRYTAEITAFDQVVIRMRLADLTQTQVAFGFDYLRRTESEEEMIAHGSQRVVCMRERDGEVRPDRVPDSLRRALQPYRDSAPDSALAAV